MQNDTRAFLQTIGQTIQDPESAAHVVLSHRYDRATLWLSLVAVVAASSIIPGIIKVMIPEAGSTLLPGMSLFTYALVQACFGAISAFALSYAGRSMGGDGYFPEALTVVIWLAVVGIAFQFVQMIGMLSGSVELMALITLGSFGWQVFIFTHFVNVLHGFGSLLKSFGLLLFVSFGIVFGLGILFSFMGFTVPAGGL